MQEFKSSVDAQGPSWAEYGIKGDTYIFSICFHICLFFKIDLGYKIILGNTIDIPEYLHQRKNPSRYTCEFYVPKGINDTVDIHQKFACSLEF